MLTWPTTFWGYVIHAGTTGAFVVVAAGIVGAIGMLFGSVLDRRRAGEAIEFSAVIAVAIGALAVFAVHLLGVMDHFGLLGAIGFVLVGFVPILIATGIPVVAILVISIVLAPAAALLALAYFSIRREKKRNASTISS